jgi:hypothetical protein
MSAITPVGDVLKIVSGLATLAGSATGQQLLMKLFLDAGLTEAVVDAHVAAMQRSEPPKK